MAGARLLFTSLLLLPGALWGQNALSDAERAAGWLLLFDGKSSEGWMEITGKPFPASWKVEDGCLRAIPTAEGNQDIRTLADFRHFDLQFEWRIAEKGNSGVKYLVQRVDEWDRGKGRQARARGLEYQLTDDATSEESKRDPTRGTGSLYSVIAPAGGGVRDRAFHRSRIRVNNGQVEHWLDGSRLLGFLLASPDVMRLIRSFDRSGTAAMLDRGPISLQNHNSDVWFRNIKILPLP